MPGQCEGFLRHAGRVGAFHQSDVPGHELRHPLLASRQGFAQRAEPAAEHAHQLADMLADDKIPHAGLAELAVHIVDEKLGKPHRRFDQRFLAFHAQQYQHHHQRHRIEAAGDGVRNAMFRIPFRFACKLDHAVPQRPHMGAIVHGLAENAGEQRHERSFHSPEIKSAGPKRHCDVAPGALRLPPI